LLLTVTITADGLLTGINTDDFEHLELPK